MIIEPIAQQLENAVLNFRIVILKFLQNQVPCLIYKNQSAVFAGDFLNEFNLTLVLHERILDALQHKYRRGGNFFCRPVILAMKC